MLRKVIHIVFAIVTTLAMTVVVSAQPVDVVTGSLKRAGISEHIGESVALDSRFVDENGASVRFGDYFDGERPVVLTFVYHECPMLCSLVLEGLTKAMKDIEWTPGNEYRAVTVSISPEESPELALRQKERYVSRLENLDASAGWSFLTGQQTEIASLTASAGFDFEKDEDSGEYGHAAVVILVSPQGVVSRYLYGITYTPFDLRAGLVEASEGKIGSIADRFIMFCYRYDPAEGSYVPQAWMAMRLAGGLTLLMLVGMLAIFWRRERVAGQASLTSNNGNEAVSDE